MHKPQCTGCLSTNQIYKQKEKIRLYRADPLDLLIKSELSFRCKTSTNNDNHNSKSTIKTERKTSISTFVNTVLIDINNNNNNMQPPRLYAVQ